MRINPFRFVLLGFVALAFAQVASAYTYIYASDNQPVRWLPGSIPIHIKLGADATSDGFNFSGSVRQATVAWNSNLSTVQFSPTIESRGPGTDRDGNTQIFFASTLYYGTAFGSSTLAVTLTRYYNNKMIEADIVFNTAYAWDSYRGARGPGVSPNYPAYDIQRVALHELGHVLGLDHTDQATDGSDTTVVAIMRSVVSDSSGPGYDSLAPDDIVGAQNLYGAAGGAAPPNDNFANAIPITLASGFGQAAGSNIYPNSASREAGEPLIVGNAGGHSVWWMWTAPTTATATIDTRGSLFDTIMGVYTGPAVNALTLVADNDDENHTGGIYTSLVSFPAVSGTTYYIAVDGFFNDPSRNYFPGETGKIQLHINQTTGNVAPTISNPANTTVNVGTNAQITVTAGGNPFPTLQWQRQPAAGGGFSNLSEDGNYTGTTSTTLTVSGTVVGMTNDQFRCVATNIVSSATSAAATLTVIVPIPPTITLQPSNQSPNEGGNASFTMAASSATSITYLWQVSAAGSGSWSNLSDTGGYSGTTTTTLSLTNVNYSLNGSSFRCLVTNPVGTTPTDAAVLTINPAAPVITSHSATRVMLNPGQSSTLSVTATGTGALSYQWYRSGPPVSGATASTLPLSNVVMADSGYYNVRVTDTIGTRRSVTFFVLVAPATTHIVSWGSNASGQTNTPAGLTTAVALAANNNASLALRADGTVIGWGDNSSGQTSIPVGLTNVVAVAVGTFHSLALKADGTVVSWGDSSYGLSTTAATLTDVVAISAGFYYSMALKADGTVVAWGETNATFYQLTPPVGLNNVIAISGTGTTSMALKSDGTVVAWGFNSDGQANVPGGLANVVGIATGTGHSLALRANGTVVAWGSDNFGQIDVPAGLTNVTAIAANNVVSFALKADGTIVEWGSDINNQFNLPQSKVPAGLSGVLAVDSGFAHAIALCDGPLVAPSIASQTGSQTVNSGLSPSFSVTLNGSAPFTYQWQRMAAGGSTWTALIDNSDYSAVTGPTLTIALTTLLMSGDQFRCVVTNIVSNVTSTAAMLTVVNGPGAPVITTHPQSVMITQGSTASFSVVASGSTTLYYQWQQLSPGDDTWRNVTNLEVFLGPPPPPLFNGMTTATLLVNTALAIPGSLNGYQFRCVVSDLAGNAVSFPATLTVNQPPAITAQPGNQAVAAGATASFTAAASGVPTPGLQWQRLPAGGGTWSDLSNGGSYAGVTTATLTVSNLSLGMNGDQFRCVATNSVSFATSNAATLTVTTPSVANDFNGDGKPDVIWQNTTTGDTGFWLMNGTGFASWVDMGLVSTDWRIAATADFNGDGKADILWENTSTGDRGFWLMNGTVYASWVDMGYVTTDWRIAAAADFNGDGKPDILWENTVTGVRDFWLMNGTVYASWVNLGAVSTDWRFVAAADFNGDGNADILMENTVTGDRGFWMMNGTAYVSWYDMGYVSTDWHIAAVADFNGDGKTDILWENTATGDRGFWLMNGTAFASWIDMGYVSTDWRIAN